MSAQKEDLNATSEKVAFQTITYNVDLPYFGNDFPSGSPLQPQVVSINLINFDLGQPSQGPRLQVSIRVPTSKYASVVDNNRELPLKLQGVSDVSARASTHERVETAPPVAPQSTPSPIVLAEEEDLQGESAEDVPDEEPEPETAPEAEADEAKASTTGRFSLVQGSNLGNAYGELKFQKRSKEEAETNQGDDVHVVTPSAEPSSNSTTGQANNSQPKEVVPPPVQPPAGKASMPSPITPGAPEGYARENRRQTAKEQERDRLKSQEMRQYHQLRSLKRQRSPPPPPIRQPATISRSAKARRKAEAEAAAAAEEAKKVKSLTVEEANSCFDLLEFKEIKTAKNYPVTAPSLQSYEPANSIPWRNLFGEETAAKRKPLRLSTIREDSRVHNPHFVTVPIDSLSQKIGLEIENPFLPKYSREDEVFRHAEKVMLYHWIVQGKSLKSIVEKYKSARTDYSISRMLVILRRDIKQLKIFPTGSLNIDKLIPSQAPVPAEDIANFEDALESLL